jgi:hypothetical protein
MSAPVAQRRRPQPTAAAQTAPVQQPTATAAPVTNAAPSTPRRRVVAAATQPAATAAPVETPQPQAAAMVPTHPAPRQPVTVPASAGVLVPKRTAAALFQPGNATPLKPLAQEMSSSPYAIFMHPQVKIYPQIMAALGAAAAAEAEVVLIQPGNSEYIHLPGFSFILVADCYFQFYADFDGNGGIVDAVPNELADVAPKKADGSKYSDVVCAVIIAVDRFDNGSEFYPCRMEFRGPKTGAIHAAVNGNIAASAPDWPGFNPDNALVAQSGLPFFCYNVYQTSVTTGNQPKDTRRGQKPYATCDAVPTLITQGEIGQLLEKMSTPEFMKLLDDCIIDHEKRVAEVHAIYNRPQS